MAEIALQPVKEVLEARELLHGGGRGAPRLNAAQQRQGAAMNRAAMVTLAASLEAFVEDVFRECIPKAYSFDSDNLQKVEKQLTIPHTTNPAKIRNAFLVLGVEDIFKGLSWRKCSESSVTTKLDTICQIRNRCAHGNEITYNGSPFTLTKAVVAGFVNFSEQFGMRFAEHARGKFP